MRNSSGLLGSAPQRRWIVAVLDIIFIAATIALIAVIALVGRAVERL